MIPSSPRPMPREGLASPDASLEAEANKLVPVRLEDARSGALRWGVVVLAAAALLALAVLLLIGL